MWSAAPTSAPSGPVTSSPEGSHRPCRSVARHAHDPADDQARPRSGRLQAAHVEWRRECARTVESYLPWSEPLSGRHAEVACSQPEDRPDFGHSHTRAASDGLTLGPSSPGCSVTPSSCLMSLGGLWTSRHRRRVAADVPVVPGPHCSR
jgi:hypothetical protein